MPDKYIGYVSTPFGKKAEIDFDELFRKAIFPSPTVALGDSEVVLFREDGGRPAWQPYHLDRIERFRGSYHTHEWQLRQAIQDNVVGADFLVAVLTGFNPNVMLEVGFAQAHKKIIVYVLQRDQFQALPANLANLKRLHLYAELENLKLNLYNRIQEVVDDLRLQDERKQEHGGFLLDYYPHRDSIDLVNRFRNAQKEVRILTTNLTTVSVNYIDAILYAATERPKLKVKILASDPDNAFIDPRADQLLEDRKGYRMELLGSFESIRAKLRKHPNCEVRTYKDFPVQLWHLIDNHIYIGQFSLHRRSRHNCAFGVSVDTSGIKETYLDHFDSLWEGDSSEESEQG